MSSPSEEVRLPAEQFLFASFQSDPFPFVFRTSTLLLSDSVELPILRAAVICVGRALSPTRSASLQTIASVFMTPDKSASRELIHRALLQGIAHPDLVVRQSAAHSIDLLFRIECGEWISLLPALLEIATSPASLPEARHGAVYTFREILTSGVPADRILEYLKPFYAFLVQLFGGPGCPPPLFLEASKAFPVLIGKVVAYQSADQVHEVLRVVELFLPHECFDVFQSMLDTLGELVRGIYAHVEPFMAQIFSLTVEGLRLGNVDRRLAILNFWAEIAQFEAELNAVRDFEMTRGKKPPRASLGLMTRAAGLLCPAVVDCIRLLEPEFDVAAVDFSAPPMVASEHLSDLYAAAPGVVGPGVLALWQEGMVSGEWRQQVTSLICMIAVAAAGTQYKKWSSPIFEAILPGLLDCCGNENDTVAYFALELFAQILSEFRVVAFSLDKGSLLSVIESTAHRNPSVIRAGCHCVTALCRVGRKDNERSLLACSFDRVVTFLQELLRSPALIPDALASAGFVVSFMPPSRLYMCEFFVALCEQITSQLSVHLLELRPDVVFSIEASICDLLNVIAIRLGDSLDLLAPRLMHLLLGGHHSMVFEETLLAIDSVLIGIGANFAPFLPQTIGVLWQMLHTGNPACITVSLTLLADLFHALPNLMEGCAPEAFRLLLPMIFDESFEPDFGVGVARALTEICAAVPEVIPADYRDGLAGILMRITREAKFDIHSMAGLNRASVLFESLLSAYRALIESARGDTAFLEANQNAFFAVVDLFIDTRASSPRNLIPFFQLLETLVTEIPGRNVRIKLNKRSVRSFLAESAKYTDTGVADNAKKLIDFLRTYKPGGV